MTVDILNTDPAYWEKVLEEQTLGVKQLGLEDEDIVREDDEEVKEREVARKKSTNNRDFEKLRTQLDSTDQFVAGGHQIKKLRTLRDKKLPKWAVNNELTKALLLKVFPKLATNPRQRRLAARWAAIITLHYRMGMTQSQVAAELRQSPVRVKLVLQRMRGAAKTIPSKPPM